MWIARSFALVVLITCFALWSNAWGQVQPQPAVAQRMYKDEPLRLTTANELHRRFMRSAIKYGLTVHYCGALTLNGAESGAIGPIDNYWHFKSSDVESNLPGKPIPVPIFSVYVKGIPSPEGDVHFKVGKDHIYITIDYVYGGFAGNAPIDVLDGKSVYGFLTSLGEARPVKEGRDRIGSRRCNDG